MSEQEMEDLLGAEGLEGGDNSTNAAAEELLNLVERIEKLEIQKQIAVEDIKDEYTIAKSHGYDTKILRKVIARRKRNAREVTEEEQILNMYLKALGMI